MDIKKICEVITIVKKSKYKAYLVGGSSRDFIYGRDFEDIDIATNAPISFLKKTFTIVDEAGIKLGSIKAQYKNLIIEFTQFREEKYDEKGTYPHIVSFLQNEEDDAKRRDFTINAIYLDPTNNEVVDPYDGIKDLFSFQLRFIGDPNVRIHEDPSRILRGIRIAYKMNFTIEEKTNEAFYNNAEELKRVSSGRIKKEIDKMIEDFGENRTEAILKEYNLIGLKENLQ